jgi:hypothetical protein
MGETNEGLLGQGEAIQLALCELHLEMETNSNIILGNLN